MRAIFVSDPEMAQEHGESERGVDQRVDNDGVSAGRQRRVLRVTLYIVPITDAKS